MKKYCYKQKTDVLNKNSILRIVKVLHMPNILNHNKNTKEIINIFLPFRNNTATTTIAKIWEVNRAVLKISLQKNHQRLKFVHNRFRTSKTMDIINLLLARWVKKMKIRLSHRKNLNKGENKNATAKEICTKVMNYMPKHFMHRHRAIILTMKTTLIIRPKRMHGVVFPGVCRLLFSKRKIQRCQRNKNKLNKNMDQWIQKLFKHLKEANKKTLKTWVNKNVNLVQPWKLNNHKYKNHIHHQNKKKRPRQNQRNQNLYLHQKWGLCKT